MTSSNKTASATFTLNGQVLRIETPDEGVAASVRGMFPAYVVDVEDSTADLRCVLARRVDGWSFAGVADGPAEFASLSDALNAVEYAITLTLLSALPEFVHLHACGAETSEGAVVALGGSGAGKSSLALSWSLTRLPVLGDDIVLVDPEGYVHPFKRLFGVHPGRPADVGVALPRSLGGFSNAEDAYFDPGPVSGWASPRLVRTLAIVQFVAGTRFSVKRLDTAPALAALAASAMPSGASAGKRFDALACMAEGAATFRVTFGDSAEAAVRLVSL